MPLLELYGYLGSVLVAVSLMMKNMWRLRWINLAGAAIFASYGLLIGAWPVFALNAFIAVVDAWYIYQLARKTDYFSMETLPPGDQLIVRKLLDFYGDDIRKFYPDFKGSFQANEDVVIIFRNLNPAGLFAYRKDAHGLVRVVLDYVVPDYRDMKNATYFYEQYRSRLKSGGFHTFVTENPVPVHQAYLLKIGFIADPSNPTHFIKPI